MAAGLVALAGGVLVSLGAPRVVGAVLAAPGWVALRLIIGIVDVAASVPFASIAFEPAAGRRAGAGDRVVGLALVVIRRRRRPRPAGVARGLPGHRGPSGSTKSGRRARVRSPRGWPRSASSSPSPSPAPSSSRGRPASRASRSSTSGRGTPSSSKARAAAGCWSTAGPIPIGSWSSSTGGSRRGIGGSMRSSCRTRTRTTSPGWRCCSTDIASTGCLEPGMRGPGPGYAAWLDRLARPGAPVRLSIAAGDGLRVDEIAMRVLWPIRGQVPDEPPDAGTRHQQRVGGAARHDRAAPVPADRRRRGGRRPLAARPTACRGSTSSRSPITAAGPRRPRRSWPRSGHGSRSPRPAPTTRTAIRRGPTLERLAAARRQGLSDRCRRVGHGVVRGDRPDGPDRSSPRGGAKPGSRRSRHSWPTTVPAAGSTAGCRRRRPSRPLSPRSLRSARRAREAGDRSVRRRRPRQPRPPPGQELMLDPLVARSAISATRSGSVVVAVSVHRSADHPSMGRRVGLPSRR